MIWILLLMVGLSAAALSWLLSAGVRQTAHRGAGGRAVVAYAWGFKTVSIVLAATALTMTVAVLVMGTAEGTINEVGVPLLLTAMLAFALWYMVRAFRRRLTLTPDGISYRPAVRAIRFIAWSDIASLDLVASVIRLRDGTEIHLDSYLSGTQDLIAMVRVHLQPTAIREPNAVF